MHPSLPVSSNPTSASTPVLQALGAVVDYGERTILQGLDLAVHAGEIYALLGANGAGKTTTLSLFLGFVRPRSGQVRVQGVDPVTAAAQARGLIAYIPENVALYEHLSARENVAYLLDLAGQPASRDAIGQALSAAGLDAAAHDRRVSGFSKGMRQKVAIALALARKVPALLLDEPTSGLDPQATAEFSRLITQLRGQGVAILMVTHDLLGAADVADRMGFIAGGRLVEEVAARGVERFDVRALHRHYAGTGTGASASASADANANAHADADADADADAGVQGAAA
ncbi:ABC transporter ATP-binding protein [Delftia sp. WSY_9]|uniref:ABC transporter ATP-binding protein n=1 Tax=unclassified Delftia TaxID=2613839 RepID=UPI00370C9116